MTPGDDTTDSDRGETDDRESASSDDSDAQPRDPRTGQFLPKDADPEDLADEDDADADEEAVREVDVAGEDTEEPVAVDVETGTGGRAGGVRLVRAGQGLTAPGSRPREPLPLSLNPALAGATRSPDGGTGHGSSGASPQRPGHRSGQQAPAESHGSFQGSHQPPSQQATPPQQQARGPREPPQGGRDQPQGPRVPQSRGPQSDRPREAQRHPSQPGAWQSRRGSSQSGSTRRVFYFHRKNQRLGDRGGR